MLFKKEKFVLGMPLGDGVEVMPPMLRDGADYFADVARRNLLFLDVLRQRGNQYLRQEAQAIKHVLRYDYEIVVSGKDLARPVNYGLVRILPPEGVVVDAQKRPFVVVDPRAGHAPGIGGFKEDSQIGVVLRAGHPCYFIGFVANPVPGQTIEDIMAAEATFLRRVGELHPDSPLKPTVVANCQAGWAMMMMAATAPEVAGPLIIAGAPLSYWAGVRGKNPMRYLGGLLGGSWMTILAGDLGAGIFDGAYLVQNFEAQNPSNTLWSKQYNLWSKIDSEAPRYLEFERWWGGHVLMNAEEMQFIADQLFIGNKLTRGEITTAAGVPVDLRQIRSPILVFCSWGDNITPPQQALQWVLDIYRDEQELIAYGQTIVYCLHDSVGHLGIFVSGAVGRKEHDQFTQNMDLIDVLAPGLYEAVLTEKTSEDANAGLAYGNYIISFQRRSFEDLRALGGNTPEEERCFETAARVSEINQGLYRTLVSPWIRPFVNRATAEWLRETHPARLQYSLFSDSNPMMAALGIWADWLGSAQRIAPEAAPASAAAADSPWRVWQKAWSDAIVGSLDAYRDWRDAASEAAFFAIYGSAPLQAAVGLAAAATETDRRPRQDPEHVAYLESRIAELRARIATGGVPEACARAIVYAVLADGQVDERGFALLNRLREEVPEHKRLPINQVKRILREQFYMLLIDEAAALDSLVALLPPEASARQEIFGRLLRLVSASGQPSAPRMERIEALAHHFGLDPDAALAPLREGRTQTDAKPAEAPPKNPPEAFPEARPEGLAAAPAAAEPAKGTPRRRRAAASARQRASAKR